MKPHITYNANASHIIDHPTSIVEKIGYGFGDMSSSMFWKIFSYYLPIFFSDVYGLSLASTGLLLLVTRIWDVVSDPIVGIIIDRTESKHGKYRPYLLWLALPFAIAGCLLFITPPWGEAGKLIWAYITYILMTTVYSAINVPYASMLCVVTPNSADRTVYSCYRMFFAFVGSFFAMFAWEPLCYLFANGDDIRSLLNGWMFAMFIIAFIGLWMFIVSFALSREHISIKSTSSILEDLKCIITNNPWRILTCVALCTNLFNAIRGTTVAYYFKYGIGENVNIDLGFTGFLFFSGLFLAVGEVCSLIGVLFVPMLAGKFGKRNTFIWSAALMVVMSIAFFYIPDTNSGFIAMLGLQIIISIASGIICPLLWSMYADVTDYSIVKKNNAAIGLIFSTGSMAQKCGGAIAGVLILWILDFFGLVSNSANQSDSAILGLKLAMSYIPAFIAFIMIISLIFYPKDKEMETLNNQLKEQIVAN